MDDYNVEMYTIDDLQRILGIGRSKAYQLASSRGFPAIKLNKKILIPKRQFSQWVNKHCGKTFNY